MKALVTDDNPQGLEDVQCFFGILDGFRRRGMTVATLKVGYVEATGLQYAPPKRKESGEPESDPADDELTFASAG